MADLATIGFRADTKQIKQAGRELDYLAQTGAKVDKAFLTLKNTIGLLGVALLTVGLKKAVDDYRAFETALLGVAKTTGLAGDELKSFSKEMVNLSLRIPVTTNELLELAQAAGQMGVTGAANLEKFSLTIAKLGRASDLAGAEAATALARIINVTGESIESIDVLASVIVSLGNNVAATESEIARMTTEVARATSVFGISSAEAAGLSAAMTSIGIRAELGGSSVGRAMQTITNAVQMGGKELDVFAKTLGLNGDRLAEAFEEDKLQAFEMFLGAVGVLGLEAGNALDAVGLGGQEIAKTIVPLANNMAIYAKTQKLANDEVKNATALNKEAEATYNSLDSQIIRSTSIVTEFGRAFVADLAPAMNESLKGFNAWAAEGDNITHTANSLVNAITAAATVLGGVMVISLGKSTAAAVTRTTALIAEIQAQQAATAAEVIRAESVVASTAAELAAVRTAAARTPGFFLNASAISALTAAERAHTVALSQVSVAQAAAAGTATLLGTAWRFMLGPVGIAITVLGAAAAAFALTGRETEVATTKVDDHAAAIKSLTVDYENLNAIQMESAKIKVQSRIDQIDEEIFRLEKLASIRSGLSNDELSKSLGIELEAFEGSADAATHLQAEIQNLIQEKEKLTVLLTRTVTGTKNATDQNNAFSDSFDKQMSSLKMQYAQLTLTANQFELLSARMDAISYGATPAMIASIEAQVIANQKLRDSLAVVDTALDGLMDNNELFGFDSTINDLDTLIDQADQFSNSWTSAGDAIIDAFGSAAMEIDNFGNKLDHITDLQDKFTEARKNTQNTAEDNLKIDMALAKLDERMFKTQITGIRSVLGASKNMFKEQSKERKVIHNLEKVFTAIEIGLALQKASANALTAITSSFAAPFPVNFAAGAAMIAIMAGLGVFGGGGGSSYTPPAQGGTGTVLGDSSGQSESISKSVELFEDIQLDQLAELQKIRQALTSLESGIEQLAKSFVTELDFGESGVTGQLGKIKDFTDTFIGGIINMGEFLGGVLGGLSSTKKSLVDSGIQFLSQTLGEILDSGEVGANLFQVIETTKKKLWGLSKSTSQDTQLSGVGGAIASQMADIFGFIGDTVILSIESLGIQTADVVRTSFDFNDLLGGEFGGRGGRFFQGMVTQTQEVVSLGLREALDSFVINIGDVSFKDKTGEEIQKELEAIFSQQADLVAEFLIPSISDYQQIGEGAFETLQRVSKEQAVFNDAIDFMGQSLGDLSALMRIDVAQSVIDMIGGLDRFQELTGSFVDKFFTDAEKFAQLESSLSEAFDSIGLSMVGSREEFKDLVNGLDLTTESGQMMFAMLMQIAPAFDQFALALEKAAVGAMDALKESVKLEKDRAAAILNVAREAYREEIRIIEEQRRAVKSGYDALIESSNNAESALLSAANAEYVRIDAIIAGAQEAYNAEINMINEQAATLDRIYSELTSNAQAAETALLAAANAEFNRIDEQRAALDNIYSGLTDNASITEEALKNSFSAEIDRINSVSQKRIDALNRERDVVSENLNVLLSLSESLSKSIEPTVKQALDAARIGDFGVAGQLGDTNISSAGFSSESEFLAAQALQANRLGEIGRLAQKQATIEERTLSAIDRQILSVEKSAEMQVQALNDQLNTLLGVDTSIMSIADATAAHQAAQIAIDELGYESQIQILDQQRDLIQQQVDSTLGMTETILSVQDATTEYQAAQLAVDELGYQSQLDSLEQQRLTAEEVRDAVIAAAENERLALEAQVNATLGLVETILTVQEATEQYQAAQIALDEFNYDEQLAALARQEEAAMSLLDLAEIAYADEILRLDGILETGQAMLNAMLGIDTTILSIDGAMERLIAATTQTTAEVPGPIDPIGGGDWPDEVPALPVVMGFSKDSGTTDIAEEQKKTNEALRSMAKSNASTAKILQRIELNGLDTRAIP